MVEVFGPESPEYNIFILHQFQKVWKFHISLTFSSSEYLPPCKERKKKRSLKISSSSINTGIYLNKKTCCVNKLSIKNTWKVSSFHFICHSIIFSVTLQLLRTLWAPHPMRDMFKIVLFWLSVYMQKIDVIQSFHQDIYEAKESCHLFGWKHFQL